MDLTSKSRGDSQMTPLEPNVDAIFDAFVRNANSYGGQKKTQPPKMAYFGPSIEASGHIPLPIDTGERRLRVGPVGPNEPSAIMPLTVRKMPVVAPEPAPIFEDVIRGDAPPDDPAARSEFVPDVANVEVSRPPIAERSEDGLIPAGELDRMMNDMSVLVRYGHREDVGARLDELLQKYPEDLLLLRRIAEFHIENKHPKLAIECLFALSSSLFERRNFDGMQQALEQVLVIDKSNGRAFKLLALLDQKKKE